MEPSSGSTQRLDSAGSVHHYFQHRTGKMNSPLTDRAAFLTRRQFFAKGALVIAHE
jgi:hypothetical protein